MSIISLPNNWRPRPYQLPAWRYLESGGKHAELIWHRRSGKDEIALHRAACAAFERVAGYWHMLPEYAQARKAIWDAVNPHTGKRRIDEAFPHELRANTREQEMQIVFKNGSTWQVVGSDNYNRLVGSTPAGIVYSEWALANPSARAYLRPILAENGGWQVFITTPRGKNHAYQTLRAASQARGAFTQILSAEETGVFTPEQLREELASYIAEFGEDMGLALYEQEYLCSFEAAILGSYYGKELAKVEKEGRRGYFPVDSAFPVQTAWDIGKTDDTSIWFYQETFDGLRIVDFHSSSGKEVDFYIDLLRGKPFEVEWLYLPHDAKAKRLGMKRTVQEQFMDSGFKVRVLPNMGIQDGIQAARKTFPVCYFHEETCADGLEALAQYRREWDDEKKCFNDSPVHDWTSHPADAFRYMSLAWRMNKAPAPEPEKPIRGADEMTFDELMDLQPKQRAQRI